MNKLIPYLLAKAALLVLLPLQAQSATEPSLCEADGTTIFFFNGVLTSSREAGKHLDAIQKTQGNKGPNEEPIHYELAYNETEGIKDFIEVFQQRVLEKKDILNDRYELFFESLKGGGEWWNLYLNVFPSITKLEKEWRERVLVEIQSSLVKLMGNSTTLSDYAEHASRIDSEILKGRKLLFVAHSQGNLFANKAYDYAMGEIPSDAIGVIHVAPASLILNGDYNLADKDKVMQMLDQLADGVPEPNVSIPGYWSRPSGYNNDTDFLGHGFQEIYLNFALDTGNKLKQQINDALVSLQPYNAEASEGFFTATLTWDGSGDVDLHVYEPTASHVYYANKTGASGHLDVDNTHANGPEHYYATCDPDSLNPGVYSIQVANYDRANGRQATVQLASHNDGVLGTKTVTLGQATGSSPSHIMFDVLVEEDPETADFKVALNEG